MTHLKNFEPTQEEIARYAYHLWEAEGRINGRDLEYWLQAEAHLKAHRQYEAKLLDAPTENAGAAIAIQSKPKPATRPRRQTKPARERVFA